MVEDEDWIVVDVGSGEGSVAFQLTCSPSCAYRPLGHVYIQAFAANNLTILIDIAIMVMILITSAT